MTIGELKKLLEKCWCKETCSPGLREEWSEGNPALGQCAITALIVYESFGGKIMRCMTPSGSHYYNLINDEVIDLTVSQFLGYIPDYSSGEERTDSYLLSNDDTRNRYLLLMDKLKDAVLNAKYYKLLDGNGNEYLSYIPGTIGGNKKLKIYGRLDCPSANRWIKKGCYVQNRVFFANEEDAISAGYRPCGVCMREEYLKWKQEANEKILKKTSVSRRKI